MSVLQKLTEGIVNRDLQKEGDALLSKWEKTGLLEGLDSDHARSGMAILLENQAKELLREASSMAGGDVEGFAAVAFPIVRRVFGGLIANQLVSVQPMSLPSGLIFFLDFTYDNARAGLTAGDSLYGGGIVGSQLVGGTTDVTEDGGGFYNLQNGYSSPTGSLPLNEVGTQPGVIAVGQITDGVDGTATALLSAGTAVSALTDAQQRSLRFDPDILGGDQTDLAGVIVCRITLAQMATINLENLTSCQIFDNATNLPDALGGATVQRRLTERGFRDTNGALVLNSAAQHISFYVTAPAASVIEIAAVNPEIRFNLVDRFQQGNGVGSVVGNDPWDLEGADDNLGTTLYDGVGPKNQMPEINISVDSVAVTAVTKKLKAKWTPELAQDLNAYHNMDAEVELTSILSEQIALEIDREILNDLVHGATADTFFWSRRPGRFIDRGTGQDISILANENLLGADFTGTVSEWYETLIETINDVSARIHVKTLRGGANFVVCGPETANILEFTAGFRASVTADGEVGQAGAMKIGAISKKWDVYVDPYFPRNVVLVGRKGSSFLESGYVYAPYVPLQVTPTIFGVEDFTPRKGVMTRYAKQMVRSDAYGLVIIKDFLG